MTQEDKQLLLADLCARLPYRVFVNIEGFDYDFNGKLVQVYFGNINRCSIQVGCNISYSLEETKPWLRPMSSMTEEEAKELLFVRLVSKYGESCAYIKNFIKLNEVSFRKEPPYEGSIAVLFSFENKIHDTPQIREYSKCEYLGQINDITLAEIDWLNAHYFDYRGLIEKGLAISTEEFNPYKE